MDEHVADWRSADLTWTPEGQEFRVSMELDERAAKLFAEQLPTVLGALRADVTAEVETAHYSVLVLRGRVLDIDPLALRKAVTSLAATCAQTALNQRNVEERRMTDWLMTIQWGEPYHQPDRWLDRDSPPGFAD